MKRTWSRPILAAAALLLCHCAPAVTASRVQYDGTMAALQLTVAGPLDREGAVAALNSFAASVATCRAYSTAVTSIESRPAPAKGADADPQVTSTVGGTLLCTN